MAVGSIKRYTARGVVLNTIKYGDKGLVVQMLTSSHGRQSFMAQGLGSRGRSSRAALFQPLFALEYEAIESTKMQMHRFSEVHAGIVLHSIPFDVKKSTIALFMAEVLHRLVKESEANEMLFDFVWGSIEALDVPRRVWRISICGFCLISVVSWVSHLVTNISPMGGLIWLRVCLLPSNRPAEWQCRNKMPLFSAICWSAMCDTWPKWA